MLIKSADDNKSMKNYPACKELSCCESEKLQHGSFLSGRYGHISFICGTCKEGEANFFSNFFCFNIL